MPNLNIVGKRKIFIYLSLAFIIFFVIVIFVKGFNFGVDFSGGSEIVISTQETYTIDQLRDALQKIDPSYATAKIVSVKPSDEEITKNFYVITVKDSFPSSQIKDEFINSLSTYLQSSDLEVEQFNDVSGYAAKEIRSFAWYAIIATLAVLLIYITIRFQFSFAIGAILALAHDVIVTLGFYSLFGIEMNLMAIAAFLTLVGYSLNNTIVVYDRIRENRAKSRATPIEEVMNQSINDVLVRCLHTSITTFIVVFLMLLMGGRSIASFAFGLTMGVVVGTYSSIFIASPIVIPMMKDKKKGTKKSSSKSR
ncbi:MAG: protein translocase subunit SecF [Defluviitoga tunisiensis]|jgi:preprotein translocase SecF subunit|uniref:Protein-export membrane protein SecF n=1 Tax=Defluviitoga tunisiensis TaxID=1006576 RepID=A0A0C7NQL3_DEFTU|nr:protein translocase subunit SecF [Defluviitoga tunisiensis]MDY0379658.1 protein translocase subunit SecF [Defluviitoga tunisiensis]CEP78162.1 Protein translocase subunit SecF [Defluviitoga tunisiensis]HOP34659.1 protein translocase subunit SecF [Defluviitoga tunisiensis]